MGNTFALPKTLIVSYDYIKRPNNPNHSQRKPFRKLNIDPAIDTDGDYLMPTNNIAVKTMTAVSFGPQDSMGVVDSSSIQDS